MLEATIKDANSLGRRVVGPRAPFRRRGYDGVAFPRTSSPETSITESTRTKRSARRTTGQASRPMIRPTTFLEIRAPLTARGSAPPVATHAASNPRATTLPKLLFRMEGRSGPRLPTQQRASNKDTTSDPHATARKGPGNSETLPKQPMRAATASNVHRRHSYTPSA